MPVLHRTTRFCFLCDTNRTGSGRCVANGQTRFRRGNMTNRASASSPLSEFGVAMFVLESIIVGVLSVFRHVAPVIESQCCCLFVAGEDGSQQPQRRIGTLAFWTSGFL